MNLACLALFCTFVLTECTNSSQPVDPIENQRNIRQGLSTNYFKMNEPARISNTLFKCTSLAMSSQVHNSTVVRRN